MSYITNQAINSRSMNGILTITDGTAILQDGKLDCENVNVKTATITSLSNSNLVNCTTSTTPSSDNSIVNKKYVVDNFVDRTNSLTQNINGQKTFTDYLICSNEAFFNSWVNLKFRTRVYELSNISYTQIYMLGGNEFIIAPNNNGDFISFYCKDATLGQVQTFKSSALGNSSFVNLTCSSLLICNAGSRYYSGLSYTEFLQTGTQLTIKPVSNSGSLALFSTNPIGTQTQQLLVNNSGVTIPTLNSTTIFSPNYNTTTSAGTTVFSSNTTTGIIRIGENITTGSIDLGTSTANVNVYGTMIFYANPTSKFSTINQNSSTLNIENPTSSGTIKLRTRASFGAVQDTFTSSAVGNTSQVDLTCSASLISNNITTPIVLGGTNNIYTNLDNVTGGGIINIGAMRNNINVKCNFNINESGYGTGQNTLIWMEGNNSRFENQNSTGGTYIFTIVESGTFNPLVINKTSVDIAGDANIEGNLILYDTTPSTLTMSVGVLGNNMTFDPENTLNTTYNFKVNDITGTSTTTPLIISTASTTISNALISNGQATFNNGATFNSVIPTCSITASSANQLVNYTTLTTQGYTTLSAVQSNGNTFTATNTFTGNLVSTSAIIVRASLAIENGTKQIQSYLTATGELTFQPFFVSNSYKFQCLNASNTADKSLLITFDKTTIQTQLEVVENATFNSTASFSGDVTLSKTKNNSTYATYNGLNSSYIGYLTEVPAGIYLSLSSNTQYQVGAITLDSTNVGFWTCNYEVEINCATAGSITKIYVFISNNNVSTTTPITLPGAKANNFSTQTYTAGDSTYHSGSFSFLQSTTSVIYGLQVKVIISSGTFERKGQIRMLRIL